MKDLKFSTTFPVYHPRKGEPTFFIEKISLCDCVVSKVDLKLNDMAILSKVHTARALGPKSLKNGELFAPKFWSGRPYGSAPIQFAEPIARNDGLTLEDFQAWFAKSKNFEGQIICWEHVY